MNLYNNKNLDNIDRFDLIQILLEPWHKFFKILSDLKEDNDKIKQSKLYTYLSTDLKTIIDSEEDMNSKKLLLLNYYYFERIEHFWRNFNLVQYEYYKIKSQLKQINYITDPNTYYYKRNVEFVDCCCLTILMIILSLFRRYPKKIQNLCLVV